MYWEMRRLAMPWRTQKARDLRLLGWERGQRVRRKGGGEERGVEVDAEVILLGKVDPVVKMAALQGVAVDRLAVQDRVAGVEVDALFARDEGDGFRKVLHELLRRAGSARVVARGLDAAGEGLAGVLKAEHVVALPAVDGDGLLREAVDGRLRVDAQRGVARLGQFVCVHVGHILSAFGLFLRKGEFLSSPIIPHGRKERKGRFPPPQKRGRLAAARPAPRQAA